MMVDICMCFMSVAAKVVLTAIDLNEETLLCRAEGNPTSHVSWIGPDGKVEKTSTGETRISLGNLRQGKYTCMAKNVVGSDQKSYTMARKYFCWPVLFWLFCFYFCLLPLLLLFYVLCLCFLFFHCICTGIAIRHNYKPDRDRYFL